jgi:hypothetical protein
MAGGLQATKMRWKLGVLALGFLAVLALLSLSARTTDAQLAQKARAAVKKTYVAAPVW